MATTAKCLAKTLVRVYSVPVKTVGRARSWPRTDRSLAPGKTWDTVPSPLAMAGFPPVEEGLLKRDVRAAGAGEGKCREQGRHPMAVCGSRHITVRSSRLSVSAKPLMRMFSLVRVFLSTLAAPESDRTCNHQRSCDFAELTALSLPDHHAKTPRWWVAPCHRRAIISAATLKIVALLVAR